MACVAWPLSSHHQRRQTSHSLAAHKTIQRPPAPATSGRQQRSQAPATSAERDSACRLFSRQKDSLLLLLLLLASLGGCVKQAVASPNSQAPIGKPLQAMLDIHQLFRMIIIKLATSRFTRTVLMSSRQIGSQSQQATAGCPKRRKAKRTVQFGTNCLERSQQQQQQQATASDRKKRRSDLQQEEARSHHGFLLVGKGRANLVGWLVWFGWFGLVAIGWLHVPSLNLF